VTTDLIVNGVAVLLTLLVLSRIAGDNPAFKLAQYLFIGSSLGYTFVVIYFAVLRPAVLGLLDVGAGPAALGVRAVPLVLGLLLLPRLTNRQNASWLANIPLGLLFGVGAALALGGAVVGTLFPQLLDSARPVSGDPLQAAGAIFLVLGTIAALSSFYFTIPRESVIGRAATTVGVAGRWLIIIAFGSFLAGAILTYLTALTERLQFIIGWVQSLL
jgi:hypothetical protein